MGPIQGENCCCNMEIWRYLAQKSNVKSAAEIQCVNVPMGLCGSTRQSPLTGVVLFLWWKGSWFWIAPLMQLSRTVTPWRPFEWTLDLHASMRDAHWPAWEWINSLSMAFHLWNQRFWPVRAAKFFMWTSRDENMHSGWQTACVLPIGISKRLIYYDRVDFRECKIVYYR